MTGELDDLHSIGAVERDTGIGRDTLRVWERRYGFPRPRRNSRGERLYTLGQVRRLQLVHRLISQGMRPGRIFTLDDSELDRLVCAPASGHKAPRGLDIDRLLALKKEARW